MPHVRLCLTWGYSLGAALLPTTLTGCLVVGYSSANGWSLWPGGLIITLILAFIYFLSRR